MQLASLATSQPGIHSAHAAPIAPQQQPPRPGHGPDAAPLRPAAANAPAALAGVIDGVARLGSAAPIVDFPGIVAGDTFDILKGSKAGMFGVRGDAAVLRMDPDHATFYVKAGALGMRVEVEVDIQQIGPDQVRITSSGKGVPNMSEIGRVVEQRTNYAVFEQLNDPSKRTIISHDGRGGIVIDAPIPTIGNAHLILQRR